MNHQGMKFMASCALLLCLNSWAAEVGSGILISGAYARATVPGQDVGAVYMTIENKGDQPEQLLGANSPIASDVMLHSTQMTQGMSSMHHMVTLEVPAHGKVELKPGSYHLMLDNLHQPLKTGDSIAVNLDFRHAGIMHLQVPVKTLMPMDDNIGHDAMPMMMH